MTVSAELLRLVADRQARDQAAAAPSSSSSRPLADDLIEPARAFLDARPLEPGEWPASLVLLVIHFRASNPERPATLDAADAWLQGKLAEARRRYAAGYYADPFRPLLERPGRKSR